MPSTIPADVLLRHIAALTFSAVTDELRARGVEFNEQAPQDEVRDALVWDIETGEGREAYLTACAVRRALIA